jgi:hypothetical protein
MSPPTVAARAALYQKSFAARAHASEIGKRTLGRPCDLVRRWQAAEGWRRFNAMSEAARREYYFSKHAKYLTNVLVTERYRRVFRLRCEGDDGNWVDLETWIHRRAHPVQLLLKLMRMPHAPIILRLDCAKTAARYLYRKPKPVVVVVERPQQPAASPYSSEWRAKISEAGKRAWVRRRRRSETPRPACPPHRL